MLQSLFSFDTVVGPKIAKDLNPLDYRVTDAVFVAPTVRTAAFFRHWGGNIKTVAPAIVYHGTRKENVPGICAHGLIVPGTGHGVKKVNGAAYGTGIYTATEAPTSTTYMCPAGFMFICAGLVGPRFASTLTWGTPVAGRGFVPHGFVIFQHNSYVVPLWLVRVAPRSAGPPFVHPTAHAMLSRFGLNRVNAAAVDCDSIAAGSAGVAPAKSPTAAPAGAMDELTAQARADEIMHKHYRQAPPKMQRKLRYSLQQLVLNGSIK
jgi:hypothetical protein